MSKKYKCIGCGIELQSEDPKKAGYLPLEKMEEGGELYCQRCFKIKNYGEYMPMTIDKKDYRKEVDSVLDQCQVAIAVFDIIDFEGSFDEDILDILREKDCIVAVNKLDLITEEKHPSQVANWVKDRLAEESIVPLDIAIISAKNGYGISGIYKKLDHFYPDGVTAIVLGVTNVGKSSIVNRMLGTRSITESKYPGTTIKNIKKNIPNTKICIIDTPGLIPEGRISDMICGDCSLKTIASSGTSKIAFKLKTDRILLAEKLLWIRVISEEETRPVFVVYASKGITFHETRKDKGMDVFNGNISYDMLRIPCDKCLDAYRKNEFETKRIRLNYGEDLVIKGLGWISVKKGPLELEICLPKKVDLIKRKALILPDHPRKGGR